MGIRSERSILPQESGFNILTGSDREKIIDAYHHSVDQNCFMEKKFFGDGHASDKIVEVLKDFY